MNGIVICKKLNADNNNVHANIGMNSNEIYDAVDDQINEVQNLTAGLTNRIVPLRTNNVNETSENIIKLNMKPKQKI